MEVVALQRTALRGITESSAPVERATLEMVTPVTVSQQRSYRYMNQICS